MHAPYRVVGERDVGRAFTTQDRTHMKAILELANQGRSDVCETICRGDSPRTRHPCIVPTSTPILSALEQPKPP